MMMASAEGPRSGHGGLKFKKLSGVFKSPISKKKRSIYTLVIVTI
jgi:hypothetical protein